MALGSHLDCPPSLGPVDPGSQRNCLEVKAEVERRSQTDLNELQVREGSDVEVRNVLLQRVAVVQLGVAPTEGERVHPVGSTHRGRAVHQDEVGR